MHDTVNDQIDRYIIHHHIASIIYIASHHTSQVGYLCMAPSISGYHVRQPAMPCIMNNQIKRCVPCWAAAMLLARGCMYVYACSTTHTTHCAGSHKHTRTLSPRLSHAVSGTVGWQTWKICKATI